MALKAHWRLGLSFLVALPAAQGAAVAQEVRVFIERHCVECHDAEAKKGGLDLAGLSFDLQSPEVFARWAKVDERVAAGEMPPKKKARPAPAALKSFTNALTGFLFKADRDRIARQGRATQRRLNRYEYEETL